MAAAEISEKEFLDIEDAIASTPRGRAFLRLFAQRSRAVGVDEVRRLTMSVRDWTQAQLEKTRSASDLALLRKDLQEMSSAIARTRDDLKGMRMGGSHNRIVAATEELDAIVVSTEQATSDILSAAETILALAGRLPAETAPVPSEITAKATDIMTACAFQDLTGQRISKVVGTLQYLERRLLDLIEISGGAGPDAGAQHDTRPDAHLLHGPQLPGQGRTQNEVDAILSNEATAAPAGPAAGINAQDAIDQLFR